DTGSRAGEAAGDSGASPARAGRMAPARVKHKTPSAHQRNRRAGHGPESANQVVGEVMGPTVLQSMAAFNRRRAFSPSSFGIEASPDPVRPQPFRSARRSSATDRSGSYPAR